ncbi:MAG: carboxylating nicotinate-nucleotide diphosphorylase [bacterium]|nr:carboxylating nicotinate-nucleotide diphosphorylase [bacterium]
MTKKHRKKKVFQIYQKEDNLKISNKRYRNEMRRFIIESLHDDAFSDITSKKIVRKKSTSTAIIVSKQAGIVAGIEECTWLANKFKLSVIPKTKDGSKINPNQIVLSITGDSRMMFKLERSILNTLQRMSGIATYTNDIVQLIGGKSYISATRKTLWGGLDKKAVAIGGGLTHRLGLYDGIMIKDNHIDYLGGIAELKHVHFSRRFTKIIEVRSMDELKQVILNEIKVDSILLDNFSPQRSTRAITWMKKNNYLKSYIIEVSGNITHDNVLKYRNTGADVLSIGALTHSAPAFNFSWRITDAA